MNSHENNFTCYLSTYVIAQVTNVIIAMEICKLTVIFGIFIMKNYRKSTRVIIDASVPQSTGYHKFNFPPRPNYTEIFCAVKVNLRLLTMLLIRFIYYSHLSHLSFGCWCEKEIACVIHMAIFTVNRSNTPARVCVCVLIVSSWCYK